LDGANQKETEKFYTDTIFAPKKMKPYKQYNVI